ncbi:MAG TPA: hypothetical protein EYQ83_05595 [Acidobacteria bacterium]|nr:hypothetical protein [Acidobacteriota bacterium]
MKRFEIGARIHEPTYGLGSVLAVEDAFIRIQFDDNTARKFLIRLAKLEPSSEPAPTSRPRARKRKTTAGTTAKAKAKAKKATRKATKKTAKPKADTA